MINENTEEGAKRAVEYFLSLYDYSYASRDVTLWKTISAEDCEFCSVVVDQIDELLADGKRLKGGTVRIKEFSFVTEYEEAYWGIGLELSQDTAVLQLSDGTTENLQRDQALSSVEALLNFEDSRWILVDIG